ncbi:DUF4212 domain-containing protein [Gammaproteobacteria bacterium LSUCC0057]|uniref:DUF4212 domain-containing protein n=1 Tax=Gammaproteobacteria bacterium LSUCC0057 TaxID=2559237 RepID=A0A4Y8UKT2_9GAMM|nr:DUF4212 domain-containing protein [Gammaproteobacteria bacterium LSUCC0057]
MSDSNTQATAYWKENLAIIVKIMVVWFVVSFGFGILLVDQLNAITIGGYKLGFWFAQQGSIYIFVVLIFYYAKKIEQLDEKYDVHED